MLAHFLAIAVALGSSLFYLAAFFFPEIHRQRDFFWCGVGWFYALVLWICAGRITGGVLLGQTASVALLGWLTWQTLSLRRAKTPVLEQTPISDATIAKAKNGFGLGQLVDRFRPGSAKRPAPVPAPSDASEPEPDNTPEAAAPPPSDPSTPTESTPPASQESADLVDAPPETTATESDPPASPESDPVASDPPASQELADPVAAPPEPTATEPTRREDLIVTEPALLHEDFSQVPEPDVVKDLEALGLIEEPDSDPFQVKEEVDSDEGDDQGAIATSDPEAAAELDVAESDVIVVKGEVVKDTDPDAWI
ncbi:Ycf66 family protein [Spirulina major CS-329]|uniref:Ycf66 family protein n=1 Tax=Spirulina TaxID=1154 RepID=UPI00232F1BD5|nr:MULTISPECIES: Ycf66 family protein [Spirulina]MDB9493389.1 Ycf66 family protein [Spirulina subsalsa CS-330]MDB9504024.1 Ycf66 family protein [Spirulina major CS-329]